MAFDIVHPEMRGKVFGRNKTLSCPAWGLNYYLCMHKMTVGDKTRPGCKCVVPSKEVFFRVYFLFLVYIFWVQK